VMQHKMCPHFEIFDALFGATPAINPVASTEVGDDDWSDDEEDEDVAFTVTAPAVESPAAVAAPAAVATPAAVAPLSAGAKRALAAVTDPSTAPAPVLAVAVAAPAPLRAAGGAVKPQTAPVTPAGKPAAVFHLAPSKKEKKMDLGEAYMKSQQIRTDTQALTAQAKTRCDLVIALTLQGKTAEEIQAFLLVCFP
jgi:hypothetical protein